MFGINYLLMFCISCSQVLLISSTTFLSAHAGQPQTNALSIANLPIRDDTNRNRIQISDSTIVLDSQDKKQLINSIVRAIRLTTSTLDPMNVAISDNKDTPPTVTNIANDDMTMNGLQIFDSKIILSPEDKKQFVQSIFAAMRDSNLKSNPSDTFIHESTSIDPMISLSTRDTITNTIQISDSKIMLSHQDKGKLIQSIANAIVGGRILLGSTDDSITSRLMTEPIFPLQRDPFVYKSIKGGYRLGWRYPLKYWMVYGRYFHPGKCGYGQMDDKFYFC